MLKLGLISAATYGTPGSPRLPGSNHGTAFASTFNGFDDASCLIAQETVFGQSSHE